MFVGFKFMATDVWPCTAFALLLSETQGRALNACVKRMQAKRDRATYKAQNQWDVYCDEFSTVWWGFTCCQGRDGIRDRRTLGALVLWFWSASLTFPSLLFPPVISLCPVASLLCFRAWLQKTGRKGPLLPPARDAWCEANVLGRGELYMHVVLREVGAPC